MAPSGRPVKSGYSEPDSIVQKKKKKKRHDRKEHTKCKQNLRQNELKNQTNHFKHGRAH